VKEGSPNKERGGCIGAGSLQSQPGANLHPNTANRRVRVAKGGEADRVALTVSPVPDSFFAIKTPSKHVCRISSDID
jgi:hypothetical protein